LTHSNFILIFIILISTFYNIKDIIKMLAFMAQLFIILKIL
jgi:hypothetical protein